jgi:hypothetical protein
MRTINQYVRENKNKLKLTSVNINGFTRSIRAVWTTEMIQDISAFHNIDAETELTRLLSEELSRNINDNIIRNLLNNDLH